MMTPAIQMSSTTSEKLGLSWNGQAFIDGAGNVVKAEMLLRYCFSTKRNAGRAFEAFRRLLKKGITVAPRAPIPWEWVRPNLLSYELQPDQREAFEIFLGTGGMSIDAGCAWGKS